MDKNIFDFLARGISTVYEKVDTVFFEDYNAITNTESTRLNHMIQAAVPLLFDNSKVVEISRELLEDKTILNQLDTFLHKCIEEKEYRILIRLFTKLDHALANRIIFFMLKRIEEKDDINEMNGNVTTTQIQLLPKCRCAWEHKTRNHNNISDDKLDTIGFTIKIGKKRGMTNGTIPITRDKEKCKLPNACKSCHFIEKLYYD